MTENESEQQPDIQSRAAAQQKSPTPTLNIGEIRSLNLEPTYDTFYAPYDPRRQYDRVRAVVAFAFVGIFLITIILAFIVVIEFNNDWTAAKDLLQLILPAETALIGSAIGFYFGTQAAGANHQ